MGRLTTVVRPDGSRWTFDIQLPDAGNLATMGEGAQCDFPGENPDGVIASTLTHPSGAVGVFTTAYLVLGRTGVQRVCRRHPLGGTQTIGAVWPRYVISNALVAKTVSGPGMAPMNWAYTIDAPGGWQSCTTCRDTRVVTVNEPAGVQTIHTFGNRWRVNEGQLLRTDRGPAGGAPLRTTTLRYRSPAGQAYPEQFGTSPLQNNDWLSSRHRPLDRKSVSQQGVDFTWEADAAPGGFDALARPLLAHKFSSLGHARTEATSYHDHTSGWVLGQLASITVAPGLVPEHHDYDPTTALRTRSHSFGLLKSRFGYHPDGSLHTVADAINPPAVLADHWRGVPRSVVFPDGSSQTAVVNNLGLVTALTNAAGTTTHYGFDAMGRPSTIVHPDEAWGAYHPTFISHQQIPFADRGLPPGHWRHTSTTGNAINLRYFDALWRERLHIQYDAGDVAGTASTVESRFDAGGRKVFESTPERGLGSVDTPRPGQSFTHDALDRVLRQIQDSELGPLTTTTEYLAGFSKRVTPPRGHASSFGHQAFDDPDAANITSISAPEGVAVSMPRDIFGKALAITRSGSGSSATRSYVYDAHQRLCKTVEPESAATIQAYDAAGNIAWRASGRPFTGTTACDQASVPGSGQISFAYDARRRLTTTSFGDGSQAISRSYTADGLLARIVSSSFTWTYFYNQRRLLTAEQFSVPHQAPGAGWNFDHGINGHGHVASLSDPWGTMHFAPNALGQPTQVSGYASGVSYHPNGVVAGYTLANGISRSLSLNTRGLPAQWLDAGVLHDQYAYDANGNVSAIHDALLGLNSRSLGYDGLDRLTSANGPWGSGQLAYDTLDNLVYSQLGARMLTHHIDPARNRLLGLSGGQNVSMGYDANGNLSSRGGQAFSFDIANRLRFAANQATYDYDGHGRRSWVVFADGSTQLNAYTGMGGTGQLRFSAHSAKGNTRYVYLGDKLIAELNSQTGVSFSHTDALGSPVARTNSAGTVTERTRYEPYGATVAGSTNPTGIGFTGHVNDADTGLVYIQQRYCDPIAGRFLSVDPVTTDANTGAMFNRYEYAKNNPYRYVDPDGRCVASRIGAASGSICGGSGAAARAAANASLAQAGQAQLNSAASGAANLAGMMSAQVGKTPIGFLARVASLILAEGAGSADKPAGVPDNWREEPTKGDGGRQWVNPDNPGDRVRVMPGNPDSPNPGRREPYVRDVRNGNQWLDVNGNRIEGKTGRNSPDTHVPAKDCVFRP